MTLILIKLLRYSHLAGDVSSKKKVKRVLSIQA